jgi:hypothetical protein
MKINQITILDETRLRRHYYHGSKKYFKPGFVLMPQPDGYLTGDDVDPISKQMVLSTEAMLETFRPPSILPRRMSVFMVGSPNRDLILRAGGYADYIYEVEPLSRVFRSNLYWYGEIFKQSLDLSERPKQEWPEEIRTMAMNYWSGAPSGTRYAVEWRTGSARVVRLIEEF